MMLAFTEEEWEEVAQEIPSRDEPVIQKYLEGRQSLVNEEGKERSGKQIRVHPRASHN